MYLPLFSKYQATLLRKNTISVVSHNYSSRLLEKADPRLVITLDFLFVNMKFRLSKFYLPMTSFPIIFPAIHLHWLSAHNLQV